MNLSILSIGIHCVLLIGVSYRSRPGGVIATHGNEDIPKILKWRKAAGCDRLNIFCMEKNA